MFSLTRFLKHDLCLCLFLHLMWNQPYDNALVVIEYIHTCMCVCLLYRLIVKQ